jgi:copper chaperone CopZ
MSAIKRLLCLICLLYAIGATGQLKRAELTASGLTCSMCSKAIYKALETVPFIEKLEVDIDRSVYSFTFKQGVTIQLDEIKKAVMNAGFTIASLQLSANFHNAVLTNDTHLELGGLNFHFVNVKPGTLDGEHNLKMLDKNFLPAAEHKKYGRFTKMKCYETGSMEPCCPKNHQVNKRVYHVTI